MITLRTTEMEKIAKVTNDRKTVKKYLKKCFQLVLRHKKAKTIATAYIPIKTPKTIK